jgi:hypothetical protein
MFSPAKTITAGLVVVALGGAFLVARPISQQPSMPGAETEAIAPTWVTGDVNAAAVPCTADPDVVDGDVLRSRNVECNPQRWTSSDPRLTGTVARRWNDDVYQTDESTISVSKAGAYMRNEGGGWACSASDLATGSGYATEALTGTTFECVGNDGYAGLSAMLVLEPTVGFNEEFVGLIFSGDFPPPPEAPPVE